jgi:hypothetical protein
MQCLSPPRGLIQGTKKGAAGERTPSRTFGTQSIALLSNTGGIAVSGGTLSPDYLGTAATNPGDLL